MRVVHLPQTAASQISNFVRALRDIGVDARGLTLNPSHYEALEGVECYYKTLRLRRHPFRTTLQVLAWWRAAEAAIREADVVHWHFGFPAWIKDAGLPYAALLNKPRIVEFWGSDIRVPEVASRDNPSIRALYSDPGADDPSSYQRSRATQVKFARYGFECLIPGPELLAYVQSDLFPSPFKTVAGLILSDFSPNYPDPRRRRPVVVHMPSSLPIKGTPAVLRAIDQLKAHYDFEFRLIHGAPRAEALAAVRDCDIFLDQFVIGSYGAAALEAMAFGKPAVCYIKDTLLPQLPTDIAFVNANQDNLAQVVAALLEDGQRRYDVGRQSRAYVEKYHDAHQVAKQLLAIYQELIAKSRRSRHGHQQVH